MSLGKRAILETPHRRRRRRRAVIHRALFFIVFIGLVVGCLIALFHIDRLKISEVTIVGAEKVDAMLLQKEVVNFASGNYFYFIPKQFVLWYPQKQIEGHLLAQHKELLSVDAKRHGFNKVTFTVVERSPFAFYCVTACFHIDMTGLVYEEVMSTNDSHIVFRDLRPENQSVSPQGTYPLKNEMLVETEGFAQKLKDLNLTLNEVNIEVNSDVTINTEQGRIIISVREPLEPQFEMLKTALSQSVFLNPDGTIKSFSYIDLRFGKKIFYLIQ